MSERVFIVVTLFAFAAWAAALAAALALPLDDRTRRDIVAYAATGWSLS